MANIVAIVGRPNVGKSTLFNRLIGERKAITDNVSGVTRDRHYGIAEWNGFQFTVVDTGGYVKGSEDTFEKAIRQQVETAIEEADVILFLVDTITGLHPLDEEFAQVIRKVKKPTFLVANKVETQDRMYASSEFYTLGVGNNIFNISSQTGSGTGDLLDEITSHFSKNIPPSDPLPKFAIIGRPNAGKSSFVNTLLGKERAIVTDIAGTTRDAIHTLYNAFQKEFILIDTAGIRKKNKIKDLEFYSVMRSLKVLEECDVCIIMVDASRGLESQDVNLIGLADRSQKGIVLMINKWDLIEKDTMTAKQFEDDIRNKLAPINYMPIIFTSVTEKKRILQTIEKAVQVNENRHLRVPTSQLNEVLQEAISKYPPPAVKGKYIKIKYVTQLPSKTPTFAFFCNHPKYIKPPYQRYLEHQIRDHFSFEGVGIRLFFRNK